MIAERNCPKCGSENTHLEKKKQKYVCEEDDCRHEFLLVKPVVPLRIFISYGRDEYATLAQRLKDDLLKRGHEVWFDKDRLKEGGYWEHYIDEGLNWVSKDPETGRVVFIMTPHSVRRPDGYCLNEIAKALTKSVPIVPVMLVYSEPPLSIYRLQYLDMQDCFPPEEKIVSYDRRLERLVLALEEKKLDFEGVQSRLLKTLNPISFAADISKLLKDFTGRRWVFEQVDHWLHDEKGAKVFWIEGALGAGKSAIAAWLRDNRREIAAFHFCDINSEEKRNPCKLVCSIAYQLSTQLPDYEERLKGLQLEGIMQEYQEAYTLFDKLIVQPFSENFPAPDRTVVVLIDALDEATYQKRNEIALFLSRCADKTPAWLRFLVTSRPESEIQAALQSLSPYRLDTTTKENKADIEEYLKKIIPSITTEQINVIMEKSEGVFLYIRYVCDEIQNGSLNLDRLDEFPQGLGEIYYQYFDRQFGKDLTYYQTEIRPLLCLIFASFEPLELGFLISILGYKNRMALFDRLDHLGSLFHRTGEKDSDTIAPFHRSLVDWITNKDKTGIFFIDVIYGHKLLVNYGFKQYEQSPEAMTNYTLEWLPEHIVQTGAYEKLVTLLKDFNYIMVKLKSGMLGKLLEDYRVTIKTLPVEQRKALRIERAFFQEKAHILRRGNDVWQAYKIFFQLAIEHADDSPLTQGAEKYLATGKCNWVWLRREMRMAHAAVDSCVAVFEGHINSVNGAIPMFDGRIMSWSEDETLRIWGNDGRPMNVLVGHTMWVNGAMQMADGHILSWSGDHTLRMWDSKGKPIKVMEGHTTVQIDIDAIIMLNGDILSWGGKYSEDHTLCIWDKNGKPLTVLEGHTDSVCGALLLPEGHILSWSDDHTLRIWDNDGKSLSVLKGHTSSVHGAMLMPDGRILSWSGDHTLRIWDSKGTLLIVMRGHAGSVFGAMLMPDGRILSWSGDTTLIMWDSNGNILAVLKGHDDEVYGALLIPDGRILSWSYDKSPRLWDNNGNPLSALDGHTDSINGVLLMPDGRILSWSEDKTLRLWDSNIESMTVIESHKNVVNGAISMLDGSILTWSKDSTLRLWSSEGKLLKVLQGHTDYIEDVMLLPDGRILSWSRDKTLRLWKSNGKPLKVLEGHTSHIVGVLLLPDSRILSWAADPNPTLRLWDKKGKELKVLSGHTSYVAGALLMPDGRILSWSMDHTLRLWGNDGRFLSVLAGHTGRVSGAMLLPDGRILSWSADKTLRLWDNVGTPLKLLKGQTDEVRGAILLSDGCILSMTWKREGKRFHLWDNNGNYLSAYNELEGLRAFPEVRNKILGKSRLSFHFGFLSESRHACLCSFNKINDAIIFWHSSVECQARLLNSNGSAVVTQDDGQVCILKLYCGTCRVNIEEMDRIIINE